MKIAFPNAEIVLYAGLVSPVRGVHQPVREHLLYRQGIFCSLFISGMYWHFCRKSLMRMKEQLCNSSTIHFGLEYDTHPRPGAQNNMSFVVGRCSYFSKQSASASPKFDKPSQQVSKTSQSGKHFPDTWVIPKNRVPSWYP